MAAVRVLSNRTIASTLRQARVLVAGRGVGCVTAAAVEDTHLDFFHEDPENNVNGSQNQTVRVTFKMPHSVPFGQELLIVGDAEVLGSWSLSKAQKLVWNEGDMWTVTVDLPADQSFQYKYKTYIYKHCFPQTAFP